MCFQFFSLIRSEAMGYINLASVPFCNASRYCEMMAIDSKFYDHSQTTNRVNLYLILDFQIRCPCCFDLHHYFDCSFHNARPVRIQQYLWTFLHYYAFFLHDHLLHQSTWWSCWGNLDIHFHWRRAWSYCGKTARGS